MFLCSTWVAADKCYVLGVSVGSSPFRLYTLYWVNEHLYSWYESPFISPKWLIVFQDSIIKCLNGPYQPGVRHLIVLPTLFFGCEKSLGTTGLKSTEQQVLHLIWEHTVPLANTFSFFSGTNPTNGNLWGWVRCMHLLCTVYGMHSCLQKSHKLDAAMHKVWTALAQCRILSTGKLSPLNTECQGCARGRACGHSSDILIPRAATITGQEKRV